MRRACAVRNGHGRRGLAIVEGVASLVGPERYLIDSNIYDRLADDPVALKLARDLVKAAAVVLHTTHVQHDEVSATPDAERPSSSPTPFTRPKVSTPVDVRAGLFARVGFDRVGCAGR